MALTSFKRKARAGEMAASKVIFRHAWGPKVDRKYPHEKEKQSQAQWIGGSLASRPSWISELYVQRKRPLFIKSNTQLGACIHTHLHTHTHSLYPYRHTLTHIHTLAYTLTLSHTFTLTHSYTLTLIHILTHTHTQSHTHTHLHWHTQKWVMAYTASHESKCFYWL